jgi:hypothetical protein
MRYYYLFRDENNGHEVTYDLFSSNKPLSQEMANKIMDIPSASRLGIGLSKFIKLAEKHDFELKAFDEWTEEEKEIKHFYRTTSKVIEGISGNY